MKLEKKKKKELSKEHQGHKLFRFRAIPEDKTAETFPTMKRVIVADIEDIDEVESLTNRP